MHAERIKGLFAPTLVHLNPPSKIIPLTERFDKTFMDIARAVASEYFGKPEDTRYHFATAEDLAIPEDTTLPYTYCLIADTKLSNNVEARTYVKLSTKDLNLEEALHFHEPCLSMISKKESNGLSHEEIERIFEKRSDLLYRISPSQISLPELGGRIGKNCKGESCYELNLNKKEKIFDIKTVKSMVISAYISLRDAKGNAHKPAIERPGECQSQEYEWSMNILANGKTDFLDNNSIHFPLHAEFNNMWVYNPTIGRLLEASKIYEEFGKYLKKCKDDVLALLIASNSYIEESSPRWRKKSKGTELSKILQQPFREILKKIPPFEKAEKFKEYF